MRSAVALSFAVSMILSMLATQWQMIFSAGSVACAFLSSTLIRITFCFVPAYKASRLDPVIALAHD
ncbi:MAG: Macrolide export ATP-binding/permease protein MacB (EC [uncultured Caballeronia sp.]|nr:MAG: Macrolide export ATP-binding/permease protein MacB (EC [uncultured Caballeronia sp.]